MLNVSCNYGDISTTQRTIWFDFCPLFQAVIMELMVTLGCPFRYWGQLCQANGAFYRRHMNRC